MNYFKMHNKFMGFEEFVNYNRLLKAYNNYFIEAEIILIQAIKDVNSEINIDNDIELYRYIWGDEELKSTMTDLLLDELGETIYSPDRRDSISLDKFIELVEKVSEDAEEDFIDCFDYSAVNHDLDNIIVDYDIHHELDYYIIRNEDDIISGRCGYYGGKIHKDIKTGPIGEYQNSSENYDCSFLEYIYNTRTDIANYVFVGMLLRFDDYIPVEYDVYVEPSRSISPSNNSKTRVLYHENGELKSVVIDANFEDILNMF